ncbi:hypothetical protein [Hoylesella marshii]|uniref:Uncharacterized protein n=1 Tax=Hoylesella marshii DSM 16973 = JCM 13450 TaxID=862515 RepID=E0NPD7_9BACT|nr:hypothetical protein [Hoylesella marshii]EFM03010.1 hypothetical protein HMPREF0658_0038 [Hoylesella marshii DSM 16973 = JCM 13450]
MKEQAKKTLTLKTLNRSNVWNLQENDIFRLWDAAEKNADLRENAHHYVDIIRSAFLIEEVKNDAPEAVKSYEKQGFNVKQIQTGDGTKMKWALKKRPIVRVTDLTRENINHISAAKLLEIIEHNFGGGWDSLAQSVQDIILSGFEISTTTLPKDRLHKRGGMYDKKVADGFEVLEIEKGTWVEAIFAKEKPETKKPTNKVETKPTHAATDDKLQDEDLDNEDEDDLPEDSYDDSYDDEDTYDEEQLTEESYRTTFDTDTEDLNMEAEEISDDEY